MKKILLIFILVISILTLSACESSVGYWCVQEIKAGDVVMTTKDGKSLGLNLGSYKLCKSGKCEVYLLEEKYEGTWEEKDGVITIKYGERTATGKRKGKNIYLEDDQRTNYVLYNSFA